MPGPSWTPSPVTMPSPLRSDARRNREKILAAASELFAESRRRPLHRRPRAPGRGGARDVFRRFPSKDDLILAMIEQRLADVAEAVEEAAGRDDAWEGLVAAMTAHRRAPGRRPRPDRGGRQPRWSARPACARRASGCSRPIADLLRRAQAAGQVRDDLAARGRLLPDRGGGQRLALPLRDPRPLAALPRGGARRDAARGRLAARRPRPGALRDRGGLRGGGRPVGRRRPPERRARRAWSACEDGPVRRRLEPLQQAAQALPAAPRWPRPSPAPRRRERHRPAAPVVARARSRAAPPSPRARASAPSASPCSARRRSRRPRADMVSGPVGQRQHRDVLGRAQPLARRGALPAALLAGQDQRAPPGCAGRRRRRRAARGRVRVIACRCNLRRTALSEGTQP